MLRVVSHITVIVCTQRALFVVELNERVGSHWIALGCLEYSIRLAVVLWSIVTKVI